MELTKRTIIVMDLIVLAGSLLILAVFIGYVQPQVIAPQDGEITTNSSVLFSFANADVIYIDDNLEFTSPMEVYVKDNIVINLKPGTYYWKLKGIKESRVHKITIVSEVDLRLRMSDGRYEVVNGGNIELDVKIYDGDNLVGNVVLKKDEGTNAKGDRFEGRQHE